MRLNNSNINNSNNNSKVFNALIIQRLREKIQLIVSTGQPEGRVQNMDNHKTIHIPIFHFLVKVNQNV